MFGGHGIFYKGKMFAIVDSKGQAFLKVDDATKVEFQKKGSVSHDKMPYESVLREVIDDSKELKKWAKKSVAFVKEKFDLVMLYTYYILSTVFDFGR